MDDVVTVLALVGGLIGIGVGTYAGVTVVSILRRRFDPRAGLPGPEELESPDARLARVEALEARVNELEERVDFAERLVATQHESAQLPAGRPRDG
ncbi:MAG TPA: hypothetical protein VFU23_05810 [Gemmatimonadales bacterium]|nr:hypothetical protein [Gemmatimonadales bacterium]